MVGFIWNYPSYTLKLGLPFALLDPLAASNRMKQFSPVISSLDIPFYPLLGAIDDFKFPGMAAPLTYTTDLVYVSDLCD